MRVIITLVYKIYRSDSESLKGCKAGSLVEAGVLCFDGGFQRCISALNSSVCYNVIRALNSRIQYSNQLRTLLYCPKRGKAITELYYIILLNNYYSPCPYPCT